MVIQLAAHHQDKSTNQILNKIFWLNLIQTKPNQNTKPEKKIISQSICPCFSFPVLSAAQHMVTAKSGLLQLGRHLHRLTFAETFLVFVHLHFHTSLSSTIAMLQGIALWSTHRSLSECQNKQQQVVHKLIPASIGLSCTFAPHDLPCNALYLVLKSYACPCNR